jgi:FeS assembly SUF system regulator
MLKLSKLADYSTVIMAHLAASGSIQSAKHISTETSIPYPTVTKLLKILHKAGFLESFNGAMGGYGLGVDSSKISLLDIINAVEGELALTECSQYSNTCSITANCCISHKWQVVNNSIRNALAGVSLGELTSNNARQY